MSSSPPPLPFLQEPPDVRAFRRVVKLAGFDGGSVVALGALSALFSLGSEDLLVAGLSLLAVGAGLWELGGRRALLAGDPSGLGRLRASQLGLLAIVVTYSIFQLVRFDPSDPYAGLGSEARGLLSGMDAEFAALFASLHRLTYTLVIALSFLFQGGLWYYYGRQSRRILPLLQRSAPTPSP